MTKERAIKILKMNEQEKWRSGITAEEEKEAVDMAVEALTEQRTHGKWIYSPVGSRCSNCKATAPFNPLGKEYLSSFCMECGANMEIFGHWFPDWSESYGKDGFRCSVCGGWTSIKKEKCERCGTKMKEGAENDQN